MLFSFLGLGSDKRAFGGGGGGGGGVWHASLVRDDGSPPLFAHACMQVGIHPPSWMKRNKGKSERSGMQARHRVEEIKINIVHT